MKYISYFVLSVCVFATTNIQAALTDGLIAYYSFDGSANDMSGNGNNGTVIGATLAQDRLGNSSSAYKFDGNDYISIADSPILSLGSNPFTIALWVNMDVLGNYYIMGHDEGPGNRNKWILWGGSTDLKLHTNSPSTGGQFPVSSPWSPEINTWYNLAITRTDQNYSLYIDGNQVATGINANNIPDPNAPLLIGSAEGGHPERLFRGSIDDVRIYNRALSQSEITQLAAVPVPAAIWFFISGILGLISSKKLLNLANK